jgi:hypothetical protein
MTFSEERLAIKPRWFTGQEWANGVAEYELTCEYEQAAGREKAIEDAKTPAVKAEGKKRARDARRYRKYLEFVAGQQ